MNYKILIVGNISESYQLGSMLVRASQELNILFNTNDTNWNYYAPSMKYSWGKIIFKILNKRPLEWWFFNNNLIKNIVNISPKIVISSGILPLKNTVFDICHKNNIKIVNYLTDSPWSKQNSCSKFISNLSKYDCIFSTKKLLMTDLVKAGAKKVHFLPFAFDPFLHHSLPITANECESKFFPDVCLIGGADADRIQFIDKFLLNFKGKLGLYGSYWHKNEKLNKFYHGVIFGDDFCKVVHNSKINIGLVRRANKDEHSMRSYEIPACGGAGIYEDTSEHRDLFQGYPEYGFFKSSEDLAKKCNWLLEHPVEREEMRQLGIELIVTGTNTYTARLKTILEWCAQN
ncbi:MAG: glycosyltransferase [Nostoc sp.]|uniref:CgeB family protein n=1 Tax=Nostoc sp. TaxID=1180 RepID=UPI002FFA0D39